MTTSSSAANLNRLAISATLHCLTGCAIGEVLGMVIGTSLGWHDAATVALAVALAFVFGYSLTIRPVLASGLPFRRAIGVALAADTVSIAVMEIVDNAAMLAIPGAMDAGPGSLMFWGSLAIALLIAFVVTVPINRWMISRGLGHAVVHQYHHAGPGHAHHDAPHHADHVDSDVRREAEEHHAEHHIRSRGHADH